MPPITVHTQTAPGERSRDNQDAFLVLPHPRQPGLLLCAVADGQGGREGGGEAAQRACEVAIQAAAACRPVLLGWQRTWSKLLTSADQAVRDDPKAGFTTLVAFCTAGRWLCGAANGDSALWVADLNGPGSALTKGQPRHPPVGSGKARFGGFNYRPAGSWTALVMTDGVWRYAGWEPVQRAATEYRGAQVIEFLRRQASSPISGRLQDDFTLIVLEASQQGRWRS